MAVAPGEKRSPQGRRSTRIDAEGRKDRRMEATWVAVGANDWIVADEARDRWAIDQQETTRVVMEEAIGSMPKGLKEGIGFVPIEAVERRDRMVSNEGIDC